MWRDELLRQGKAPCLPFRFKHVSADTPMIEKNHIDRVGSAVAQLNQLCGNTDDIHEVQFFKRMFEHEKQED